MTPADPQLHRASRHGEESQRILLVSSDAELIALARRELDGGGREVVSAADLRHAQERLDEDRYSMLLLDLDLPEGDSRTLLGVLRERPGMATMPIIALGAAQSSGAEAQLYSLGADQFLAKPIDAALLRAATLNKLQRAADIRRESRQDALTGLPNRAAFAEAYDRAVALARRNNEPLAVAMLDLDHFKQINDRFGHAQGDEVLRHLAVLTSDVLRRSDMLARWGGEEFVVLLPNTDAAGAERALVNVQEQVRRTKWTTGRGEEFTVAFSAGIADASGCAPLPEVVARADYFLYLAKASGRDRVLSEHSGADAPSRRVLLAQQDDLTATMIRHRLAREGLEVVHHVDLDAAAAMPGGADLALAILDVGGPDHDGFRLLAKLRERSEFAGVPIILLTNVGSEAEIVRGLEMGASDYVVKPFKPVELVSRVQRHLRRRSGVTERREAET